MKKILFLFFSLILVNFGYSQKKKPRKKPLPAAIAVLAKAESVSAELFQDTFYVSVNGTKKDTVLLKKMEPKTIPLECKILPFMAKNVKLYGITWTEKKINQTKLKTEEITLVFTQICDLVSKTKVFSNIQTTTNISEIHYLDTKLTVSETLQRVRREGFELIITPQGELILKNKSQENWLSYNPMDKKFVNIPSPKRNK